MLCMLQNQSTSRDEFQHELLSSPRTSFASFTYGISVHENPFWGLADERAPNQNLK